jgi:hypothetical protein
VCLLLPPPKQPYRNCPIQLSNATFLRIRAATIQNSKLFLPFKCPCPKRCRSAQPVHRTRCLRMQALLTRAPVARGISRPLLLHAMRVALAVFQPSVREGCPGRL